MLELMSALQARGVTCWLDGGWGVDCLLEVQTREHGDVDLVVSREDLVAVGGVLRDQGFRVLRDWLPTSLALAHEDGREVDLHPVDLTPDGGGDQLLPDGKSWHYSAPGTGSIAGRDLPCASAADQLRMRQGFEPRPTDVADVRALCARFDLQVPDGF